MNEPSGSIISRRGLLRTAGVSGLAVLATGGLTLASATPAAATQREWFWCRLCEGLFFRGGVPEGEVPQNGWCPSFRTGNGAHLPSDIYPGEYRLKFVFDGGRGQSGWAYCKWCRGLFFARNGQSAPSGVCPGSRTGLGHLPPFGSDYRIEYAGAGNDGPGGQNQWTWCSECEGLWFRGNGKQGACWGATVYPFGHALAATDYILRFAR